MADEAAVESLTISKFFCHKCNNEINRVQPDYTCPICHSGFIEALEQQQEPSEESDSEMEIVYPFGMLNQMLMGTNDSGSEERRGATRRRTGERRRGTRGRQNAPFEAMIQDFIVNLTEVGLGGAPRTNGQVLFLGNPGDYAWGREGLDAIVTQLLNQMDGTGPPPLSKEKIEEIPVVPITQDQVDSCLQCTVCWEPFKVNEPVRKLICEHVYHDQCIVPWLDLHGTCPICRKILGDDEGIDDNDIPPLFGASGSVSPNFAALFRAANESASSRASSSSSDSSSTSSSNNTSYGDPNMDLEFD